MSTPPRPPKGFPMPPKTPGPKTSSFLGEDDHPPAAPAASPAPTSSAASSSAAPAALPWEAFGDDAASYGTKQLPLRTNVVLFAKLNWLAEQGAIRSKMGFMTEAVASATAERIKEVLVAQGVEPAEAERLAKL